ncbi:MAG: hypothetical protein SGARI_001683 [Bacillariaceae sp.]
MEGVEVEMVEEDMNGLLEESMARLKQHMEMTDDYVSKYGKSVTQLERVSETLTTTFNATTRAAYARRYRSVQNQSMLLKNDCTALSTASKLDTSAIEIIVETSNNGDGKADLTACGSIQTLSSTLRSALPSCSKSIKLLVEKDYMECECCKTMLRKELCSFFGSTANESELSQMHFICRGCGLKAIQELESLSTTETPKKPLPSEDPNRSDGGSSSSKKKKSKKKKKRKSAVHSTDPPLPAVGPQELVVDDKVQGAGVLENESQETVPAKVKYPSNARLVNTLAKNHSILALNDYLDECEGDEYEDMEPVGLEKLELEEFRDECLEAARSHGTNDKTKAAATKGYLIAAQMVAQLELSEAVASAGGAT